MAEEAGMVVGEEEEEEWGGPVRRPGPGWRWRPGWW